MGSVEREEMERGVVASVEAGNLQKPAKAEGGACGHCGEVWRLVPGPGAQEESNQASELRDGDHSGGTPSLDIAHDVPAVRVHDSLGLSSSPSSPSRHPQHRHALILVLLN